VRPGKVDVVDDAKPEGSIICVSDAAQQVLLEARGQELAFRSWGGWCTMPSELRSA